MFDKSDVVQRKSETIQDIAMKVVEEQMRSLQLERYAKERTVFILGSQAVGKSTVINKFFEREETTVRPTWALEYCYGRRSAQTQHVQKQVLNVWELGTLDDTHQLIAVPLNTHGVANFASVIMLDLSQPQRIWGELQLAYHGLLASCQNILTEEELQKLREQAALRLKWENIDDACKQLLPFPSVIVGAKYDLFMNLTIDVKQHVCRCLRSMAHLVGASVLFYSSKVPKLAKTLRDTISHLGFGSPTNPFRSHVTDPKEPLSIWFGTDNWLDINGATAAALTMAEIGRHFESVVPQLKFETQSKKPILDPANDAGFKESIIDEMRAQKDEELHTFMSASKLRGKFEIVAD